MPQGTIPHICFREQSRPSLKIKIKLNTTVAATLPCQESNGVTLTPQGTDQTRDNDDTNNDVGNDVGDDDDDLDADDPDSLLTQLQSHLAREALHIPVAGYQTQGQQNLPIAMGPASVRPAGLGGADVRVCIDDGDGSSDGGDGGDNSEVVDPDGSDDFNDDELVDEEDAPAWNFADDEKRTSDADYVFCPAAHRAQTLRIFTRHFCRHPIFRTRSGQIQNARQIREASVQEMYLFCHARNLREVWAYLWNQWYDGSMWALWARSSSPYLSRLRTTMTVENHWKQIKHHYLHYLNRPRLDLTIFILCTEVAPNFIRRSNELAEALPRGGRIPPLTTFQKVFKKSWKLLRNRHIGHMKYDTDVNLWTCSCGSQELHAHHLCKHLVQAVTYPLPPRFFHEILRRCATPLYRHPHLQEEADSIIPEDGCISDGDDRPECIGKDEYLLDGKWQVSWVNKRSKRKASVISISSDGDDLEFNKSSGIDIPSDDEEVCYTILLQPL